jgi:SAM-dependent methyltransferase
MNRIHHLLCSSTHWRRILEQRVPSILDGVKLGTDVLEIGPGPGLTSDILRSRAERLTVIEADPRLAESLRVRMCGANVDVVTADATAMPFPDATFSGCATFTMLHHVLSTQLQDAVLCEMRRVLRPGGELAGSDSLPSAFMRLIHLGDTFVPVNPDTFPARLEQAGFEVNRVERASGFFWFHARRPA